LEKKVAAVYEAVKVSKWEDALRELATLSREDRSVAPLQLLEARCQAKLSRWGNAQRAAARVVEATASYSPWRRGQPRMLAVALGCGAALELGDGQKALSFLSSALKYDPDQEEVRVQYNQLKKVVKLLKEAETQLTKGYNHAAIKALDESLAKLRGMDASSSLFRAQVLLKRCRARSSMGKHEEATDDCQTAYNALSDPGEGVKVSPVRLVEALEARAEAFERDQAYDEAVADLRAALDLGQEGDRAAQLQNSLRRMQDLQRRWRCVDPSDHKVWQENRCGHPRPENGRDHRTALELPTNLGELKQEAQCGWVTRQYRKLAKKWHPDRYKGSKERAQRKMRECIEAKEILSKQLRCGSR